MSDLSAITDAALRDERALLQKALADGTNYRDELGKTRDALQAQQAALAAAVAEVARLKQQGGGAVPYIDGMALAAGGDYSVPPNLPINIVVNQPGVTLRIPGPNWPKGSRKGVEILADNCTIKGTRGQLTADAPPSMPDRADGRVSFPGAPLDNDGQPKGIAEFIAVGSEATGTVPVRNTRLIDVTGGRVNALLKTYPGADGILIDRIGSTTELRADGVYIGGSVNVTLREPDLTAKNENTVRATSHKGILPRNITVVGGGVRNTGNKAALNPRNVDGFVAFGVRLFATGENSAVGIGNGDQSNPGNPINVTIQACPIDGGGIMIHQGHTVSLLGNPFRWPTTRVNTAISVNAKGDVDGVTIIGNAGE